MSKTTRQGVLFQDLFHKPVSVTFSEQTLSSDGGLLLLKARDRHLGLTVTMTRALRDRRQAGKVQHALLEQLQQRVYAVACGYPDVNEAAALAHDPIFKLACGRRLPSADLASQPTLSRFENAPRRSDLYRLQVAMLDTILKQLRGRHRRARRIWIDVDPTCTPTHGEQQLTFFNGYYDTHCYLPLVLTISFDDDPRKYPVLILLRPGNAEALQGLLPLLTRLVPRLRAAWPKARLWLRADSAYARTALFDWLEQEHLGYDISMPANAVLNREVEELLPAVRALAVRQNETIACHVDFEYKAGSWRRSRRLLAKVEVVVAPNKEPRDNLRYVVTSAPGTPEHGFTRYYGHSDMENTLKDLKEGAALGRFSCSSALANQWRALLSLAAFTLVQGLAPSYRVGLRPQIATIRAWLLKVAVRVTESARRIVVELAEGYPWATRFRQLALRLGAVPL